MTEKDKTKCKVDNCQRYTYELFPITSATTNSS